MSKVELKHGIFIEGIINDGISRLLPTGVKYLYQGKTSEISEELLSDVLEERSNFINESQCTCGERNLCYYCENIFYSKDKDFITQICPEEYCIIYKEE